MNVVVIGCGPAGLAAAHAAVGLGANVRIISPKKKTPQNGPIFLQSPIPEISTEHPQGYIKQILIGGSVLDYGVKVYGDVNSSINHKGYLKEGIHTWSIEDAYTKMWSLYHSLIDDRKVLPAEPSVLSREADLVVNTAPASLFCVNSCGHQFRSAPIALVFRTSYPDQPENTVIYNAYKEDTFPASASSKLYGLDARWVRSSNIFGNLLTEYRPQDIENPDIIVNRPLNTDCDCHPRVLRTGRFGKWNNLTWVDSAYYDTRTMIYSMLHGQEWAEIK